MNRADLEPARGTRADPSPENDPAAGPAEGPADGRVPAPDPGAGAVYVVLPGDIDDATAPSGGNVYDRRVCDGLTAAGRTVHEIAVPGTWPRPDAAARAGLGGALAAVPDGSVVLMDGLVACAAPEIVVPGAARLRLAVLVHLPLAAETGLEPGPAAMLDARERETLHAAHAVVVTSPWAARRLIDHHGLAANRVHVVIPGADPAPVAAGTDGASRLLCVASVTPRKGHDLLVAALAEVAEVAGQSWTCDFVGPRSGDPAHAQRLERLIDERGLGDRVRLTGPLTGERLAAMYASADLLVLASRAETYGMVVTEALAHGIPVLATSVDGVPDALGLAPDGSVPGILVPPEQPAALAAALARWLAEPGLRRRLRTSARQRRDTLQPWDETARRMAGVLDRLHGLPVGETTRTTAPEAVRTTAQQAVRAAGAVRPGDPRFSPDWLALRESADAAARAAELLDPLGTALSAAPAGSAVSAGQVGSAGQVAAAGSAGEAALVIRDLGCGTGSLGRWLAGRLPGPQHWILHDRDPELLARAAVDMPVAAADGGAVTVETREGDLAGISAADLAGTSLVTASALLDLLTYEEVDRLAAACAGAGCPALLTLSVVGKVELDPADPLDPEITAAFNAHQRRVVGGRRLLGPDAVTVATEAFERHGAVVRVAPSPWRLGADQAALTAEWLQGWVAAATHQRPDLARRGESYLRRRLTVCAAGGLEAVVQHSDLLVLPGSSAGAAS